MSKDNQVKIIIMVTLMVFILSIFLTHSVLSDSIENLRIGPFVDKLVFKVIQDDTQQVLALIDGDVDIIGRQLDPIFLDGLYDNEDIEVSDILRLGYGITEINCAKYPMNITNFRRAVAFALDKYRIIEDGWLGLSELLDCHIPRQHPASIEEDMLYHYYDENIEEGARLLELAGFVDSDDDGWLEGPGPTGPGTVELETIVVEGHPTTQIDIFVDIVVQALLNLNINAEARQTSFDYNPLIYHPDYDMIFRNVEWDSLALDDYAREYSTEYINVPGYNIPNWSNATWDSYADIILHSTDYDEILDAVRKMEDIWVHAQPSIVMFQNTYFTAARTDTYEGIIPTIFDGMPSYYTNLKVHRRGGDLFGGTYVWANPLDILSFNPLSGNSAYAKNVLDMMYDPLLRFDPYGNLMNWLADSYMIETHSDNSFVLENHVRITFNLVDNATWSDGLPLTAQDVAFTFNLILEENPIALLSWVNFRNIFAAYAPTDSTFVLEFSEESYWYLYNIAEIPILPKHMWVNYLENYDDYQPSPSTIDNMVVSGPFKPTTWVRDDFVEMEYNPLFFHLPDRSPEQISQKKHKVNQFPNKENKYDEITSNSKIQPNSIASVADDEISKNLKDTLLQSYIKTSSVTKEAITTPEGESTSWNADSCYENLNTSLQGGESLPMPTCDLYWWSRWNSTPNAVTSNDILIGDHIEVECKWSDGLPEYNITRTELEFISGYNAHTDTIVMPDLENWPFTPDFTDTYALEIIKGIKAGDCVNITCTFDAPDTDPAVIVYEWIDGDFGEQLAIFDDGTTGDLTETGLFQALSDMDIAICIYSFHYAYTDYGAQQGDYLLILDFHYSPIIVELEDGISFDTYDSLVNTTNLIKVVGYTNTNLTFQTSFDNVTFANLFYPHVDLLTPNGGEDWSTGVHYILWSAYDNNSDDALLTDIYLSRDNGTTWMLFAGGLDTYSYEWDPSEFQVGESWLVKAVVMDNDTVYTGMKKPWFEINLCYEYPWDWYIWGWYPWVEIEGLIYPNFIGFNFDLRMQKIWPGYQSSDTSDSAFRAGTITTPTTTPTIPTTTPTTPTTTSTTSATPYTESEVLIYLSWGITIGSLVVIAIFSIMIYKARRMGQWK